MSCSILTEEEFVELRRADDEQPAELLAMIMEDLEAPPIAKKLASECRRCDYVAIGKDLNEILLNLGEHVRQQHPQHYLVLR